MAELSDQPPLMLCMESAEGEEVALRIEPGDDFQSFINKSRTLLGFEIDLNSITKNQPVSLNDNIYQFLINAENNLTNGAELRAADDFDQILESNDNNNDLIYILDDGTQIRASQIHFDNEDPLVDLSVEKIPFVKFSDAPDDIDEPTEVGSTKTYNIIESPVPKWSNHTTSPSFVNTLPFKLISNNTSVFEAQFAKYLETTKTYATLNNVTARNKSPRSLLRENYKSFEDNFQNQRNTDDFSHYTREEILNMFKDSPVASLPYENQNFEKRRHVRKSDPSRLYKSLDPRPISSVETDGMLIAGSASQNCFICDKYVDSNIEKLYLFDNEDQRLHRLSPQKKKSQQLKIICERCLEANFKRCRMKSPNQCLNTDEYLIIRNNQQYIFKKTSNLNLRTPKYSSVIHNKSINEKIGHKRFIETEKTEYVKVEIGSDGEIVTKPIDNDLSDDVVIVKDEKDSSSDVEIIENGPEIDDSVVDNLDEADEEVKEFLGKYSCGNSEIKELKCRFCEIIFADLPKVIEHVEAHKHVMEDGDVYPCPLCDYGYANSKWLTGHLKTAHDKAPVKEECLENQKKADGETEKKGEEPTSPIAKRTRSASKKSDDETAEGKSPENSVEVKKELVSDGCNPDIVVKTEIKREVLESSDDEIWIVQTGDEDAEQRLQEILDAAKSDKEVGLKKHKCSMCSQLFLTSELLANHKCKRRVRKRKSISKDDTSIRMPTSDDFMKRAQGRRMYDEDDDLLTVRPRRRKNKEPTSDPQVVTCHNCNESFTSKVRLKFHIHHHCKSFSLSQTGNSISVSGQFHESTNMFTPDGEYACTECDSATFRTETELFDHVHFQHKKKRWQCPVKGCGKTFYLRATLTKHSRTHTDTRRYACTTCGKRFLDKQTLDEHGVTHLQIKPFQCHICLKQLTRRSRLRMHLRAHEEELCPRLVLVCAVCARAFRGAHDVQEHLTKFPECIEEFANELKEENEAITVQLSPTSGIVRHTVQVVESPKLSKPIRRQVDCATAAPLLAKISDEARSIIRVVEIEKAFRCEYCEDTFYSEDGLNVHRVIHKGIKNPFTCHICKVTFATYSRCTTHKTTHGFYKRSLADVKKQAGKSPSKQEIAGPSSTGILGYGDFPVVKHFLCEDCGRSYLHWTYLQVHRRMKHAAENNMYPCNQCDSTFPNSWSLTYHKKKTHTKTNEEENGATSKRTKDDYKIPCRDCDEILPNKTALYKHRKKEHSDNTINEDADKADASGPATSCSLCGVVYVGRNNASACSKCTRSFSSASLRQRMKLRNDKTDVDYTCDFCKKTFKTRTELVTHTRTHSSNSSTATATAPSSGADAKPHACSVCSHRFRTLSMRSEHMRIHTGERPYPCDICGIAFRRSTAMRNHRLIHTGVRAWACARCPKRFRLRSDLRTHARLKHPAHVAVIEIKGLNPSPEEVMEHLTRNNIPHDKVIEITKISFAKGTKHIVPDSAQALSMLSGVPRAKIACSSSIPGRTYELFQPPRRGRGIAKNPRKPKTPQEGETLLQPEMTYPITLTVPAEHATNLPQEGTSMYPIGQSGGSKKPETVTYNINVDMNQVHHQIPSTSQSGHSNKPETVTYNINVDMNQVHNQGMNQNKPQASITYPMLMDMSNERGTENASRSQNTQTPLNYPITMNVSNEELSDLNMNLLLRDGVLANGNQMVQLQLDDSMLLE